MLDEHPRLEGRQFGVEAEDEGRIHPGLGEQAELLVDAGERLGAELGAQQAQRVAVERDGHHLGARVGRGDAGAVDHRPVPGVHAVELADRDDARSEAGRHLRRVVEDDHQLDLPVASAPASVASSLVRPELRSHHSPTKGSARGTQK